MDQDTRLNLTTEGVLVLASSRALQAMFAEASFDYRFPEGLEQLLVDGSIVALTTDDADELGVALRVGQDFPDGDFDRIINQHLVLHEDDELLILNHADFTSICDMHKGDYSQYRMSVEKIAGIGAGVFKANLNITNRYDPEDPYFVVGYDVLVVLMEVAEMRWTNEVADLGT